MEYVNDFINRVHAAGSWVHGPSLNEGCPSGDLRSRSKRPKGYFPNLIVVVGAQVDGSQCLIGWQQHSAAGVVAPWPAWPELTRALRYTAMCSIFSGFSSYGTVVAWGSHLCNPRLAAVNEKGCTTVAMSSLTSTAMGAGSTNRTVLKTGKTGVATRVEDHRGVGSVGAAS
jgi:hypothetical protein